MLFIVNSDIKYANNPNVSKAITPFINCTSKLIVISAVKLPIDIPIT